MQQTQQTTLTDSAFASGGRDTGAETVEVTTETPAVVDDPDCNPFDRVEDGSLTLPDHDEWACSGVVHQPAANAHSISWRGSHGVPGYEWSEKALVVIETDDSAGGPYALRLYPFDGDGETPGLPQPHLTINEYDRLRDALVNADQALGLLADRDPGDPVAIAGLEDHT